MKERVWEIAICGTFDVQNYGDLLFPIIAEAELAKRLGRVKLHRFSYHAKTPPEWPYIVTSVTELPHLAMSLDGVLIGGGFIIRFDKDVAPAYGPPTSGIHHPTGYWLTPALIALQHGIPLIWNAPGMHCNNIPRWAEPLMRLVLQNSPYIRVRDKPSQEALKHFCDNSRIAVLPDTAFGISRLVDNRQQSAELDILRELSGFTGPYIIVQAVYRITPFIRFIQNHRSLFKDIRFLILPIGPVLGDHETIIGDGLPDSIQLPSWPPPLLLAELISQAEAVIGHSYHLAITALACGVPVFSSADLSAGKYTALSEFETIFALPGESEIDPHQFLTRLGKGPPSLAAQIALEQLDEHWDHIAKIIREGRVNTQSILSRFWQSLPNLLEAAPENAAKSEKGYVALLKATTERPEIYPAEYAIQQGHVGELGTQFLAERDAAIIERDTALAGIHFLKNTRSWQITKPLRFLMRLMRFGLTLQERSRLMVLWSKRKRKPSSSTGIRGGGHAPNGPAAPDRPFAAMPAVCSHQPGLTTSSNFDVVCFANIDWSARFQRPQQMMRQFAEQGYRVFYVVASRGSSGGQAYSLNEVSQGIFEVALSMHTTQDFYTEGMSDDNIQACLLSLEAPSGCSAPNGSRLANSI